MAYFDHFPILISQLVRTHEDHDTVNAQESVPPSRTLAYKTNHPIIRTVQFGSAELFLPELCCIYRADEQSCAARSTGLVERKTYDPWHQKADT
jgi:hypothetical protein